MALSFPKIQILIDFDYVYIQTGVDRCLTERSSAII